MKVNHTKGPWTNEGNLTVFGYNGLAVAHTSNAIKNFDMDECVANARLISSAPELLEALKLFVSAVEDGETETFTAYSAARKAIAKAIGYLS